MCAALAMREPSRTRPTSAEEWRHFWPASQQSEHLLGNSRLLSSEALFLHRDLVEVARKMSRAQRLNCAVADRAFVRVCGRLADLEEVSTGRPMRDCIGDAPAPGLLSRLGRRIRNRLDRMPRGVAPWDRIRKGWVKAGVLQEECETWIAQRRALADSPARDVLAPILGDEYGRLVDSYRAERGPQFNRVFTQVALYLDRWTTG